jgi:hypothetical protein
VKGLAKTVSIVALVEFVLTGIEWRWGAPAALIVAGLTGLVCAGLARWPK